MPHLRCTVTPEQEIHYFSKKVENPRAEKKQILGLMLEHILNATGGNSAY